MYRELGLLLVLLLPVVLVYLFRGEHLQPSSKSKTKKSKKKNKKKTNKSSSAVIDDSNSNNSSNTTSKIDLKTTVTTTSSVNNDVQPSNSSLVTSDTIEEFPANTSPNEQLNTTPHIKSKQQKLKKVKQSQQQQEKFRPASSSSSHSSKTLKKADFPPLAATPLSSPQHQLKTANADNNKETTATINSSREIDEHMDLTPRFSRVMRIRPETPDEPLSPVPYEDGWNRTKTKSIQGGGGNSTEAPEPLTKKQRENRARTARKKELKAQADALQEQRLRQHQRQLEQERIKAFYATGAGKHTPWGSKPKSNPPGSSKVPTGKAGLNEFGQLIWD